MIYTVRCTVVFVLVVVSGATFAADTVDTPRGEMMLTVSGTIGITNFEGAALFDLEMPQTLGSNIFKTATIWTPGAQIFTGARLAELPRVLGVKGRTPQASAMNDYAVEIPVSDAIDDGPIFACARNGAQMSTRDKGPLWIGSPYDSSNKYRSELIYSRSVWQFDRIEVRP